MAPCRTATAVLHVSPDLRALLRRRLGSEPTLTIITRVANHWGSVRARTTATLEADGSIDQPGSTDPG